MVGPATIVTAPPLRPPVVGLLQAADVVEHGPDDRHWFAGLKWVAPSNEPLEKARLCDDVFAGFDADGTYGGVREYEPFVLVAHDQCSTWDFESGRYIERAREVLAAKEWGDLEREFEEGALVTANPHLAATYTVAGSDPVDTTQPAAATARSPKNALAALDEAIASARIGQGMIHAPSYVIAQWVSARAITSSDGEPVTDSPTEMPKARPVLLSPNGNIIVAGSGYEGRGPAGTVPGSHASQWAYATDLITVHRDAEISVWPGEDDFLRAVDSRTNTVAFRASRAYAVQWSRLLHAAVNVDTAFTA